MMIINLQVNRNGRNSLVDLYFEKPLPCKATKRTKKATLCEDGFLIFDEQR